MPETGQQQKWSARPVGLPASWMRAASDPGDASMLAIGSGQVAFESANGMCGYDELTGARLWCARKGASPGYASGVVFYVESDGTLNAVAARSGQPLWRRKGARAVWAFGDDLIVLGDSSGDGRANGDVGGLTDISASGTLRWWYRLNGPGDNVPHWFAPFMLWREVSDGAMLTASMSVLRLGSNGGYLAAVPGWEALAVEPPFAITNTFPNQVGTPTDNAITFQFAQSNLHTGKVEAAWVFKPDYQQNAALFQAAPGSFSSNKVRVDGDSVYLIVGRQIYRYRLADPNGQRPLLVASDARFLGGPYWGTIYIERDHQVWALTPGENSIRSLFIQDVPSSVASFSIAGDRGFVVKNDGWVHGFALSDGRPLMDVRPCKPPPIAVLERVAASDRSVFVACSPDGTHWRVAAYRIAGSSK